MGDHTAIEVKATEMAREQHLRGLKNFAASHGTIKRKIVVSQDRHKRKIGDVEILPYGDFLEQLWAGEVFS